MLEAGSFVAIITFNISPQISKSILFHAGKISLDRNGKDVYCIIEKYNNRAML